MCIIILIASYIVAVLTIGGCISGAIWNSIAIDYGGRYMSFFDGVFLFVWSVAVISFVTDKAIMTLRFTDTSSGHTNRLTVHARSPLFRASESIVAKTRIDPSVASSLPLQYWK